MSSNSGDDGDDNAGYNRNASKKSSGLISSLLQMRQKNTNTQSAITEDDLIKKKGSIRPDDVLKLNRYTNSTRWLKVLHHE